MVPAIFETARRRHRSLGLNSLKRSPVKALSFSLFHSPPYDLSPFVARGKESQTDTRRGSCCWDNVLTAVDGRQMLARCWCNGGSCNNGVNGGGCRSLRIFNGSCCIGSRCEILPGERRTVNRGLRRFFWKPLQQQLQTDVSSSSDIVSPWLPTWPDSIEPFAVITSPSRRTAPCAACVITIFFFVSLSSSGIVMPRTRSVVDRRFLPSKRVRVDFDWVRFVFGKGRLREWNEAFCWMLFLYWFGIAGGVQSTRRLGTNPLRSGVTCNH